MKRRGNYGNVDSNTGCVPDTPTQIAVSFAAIFGAKPEKHARVNVHITGTLLLRQRYDKRSIGARASSCGGLEGLRLNFVKQHPLEEPNHSSCGCHVLLCS